MELPPGWAGTSDPAITWDSLGIAYLVALPFRAPGPNWTPVGIAVYKSTDGGKHEVWDNGSNLCFARTTDHGLTWKGTGADPVGSVLATDSFSPELSVASDGTIYIVWINGSSGTQIKFVKSTNGGDSFSGNRFRFMGLR